MIHTPQAVSYTHLDVYKRQALHVVVRHHALQVVLERCRDGGDGKALLQRFQHLEVVAHHHIGLAGEEELHAVDLRAAHPDGDVEPGLLIEPGRLGLVEAAMLRLREPAGEEGDLVGGAGRAGHEKRGNERGGRGGAGPH